MSGSTSPGNVLLEMQGIGKTFPGVRALEGVQLTVKEGQVHALLGENGAGKSTLIKILSGAYRQGRGADPVRGTARRDPRPARRPGAGHLDHLPGVQPRPRPHRRRERLPRTPAHEGREGGLVDGQGPDARDPRHAGGRVLGRCPDLVAVRRRAAARRDRQGPQPEDPHPGHGRAVRPAGREGSREPVPGRPLAPGPRDRDHLHLPPPEGDLRAGRRGDDPQGWALHLHAARRRRDDGRPGQAHDRARPEGRVPEADRRARATSSSR